MKRVAATLLAAAACINLNAQTHARGIVGNIPGMPEVPDASNLYSESAAGRFSTNVLDHLERIYVPSRNSNVVSVVEPGSMKLVDQIRVDARPRFVVPAWDLKTLWIVAHNEGRPDGSLTPLDPASGRAGAPIKVDAPHNLYWSADGRHAVVVNKVAQRLDFRDARTMALDASLPLPECKGVSHAEVSIGGRFAAFTCEDNGAITKVDLLARRALKTITLSLPPQAQAEGRDAAVKPQDMRLSPDGQRLFVSDLAGGVHLVNFAEFRQTGFIRTGPAAHGLYPSRDGKRLYVANRGTREGQRSAGSVSVIDFDTSKVVANWPLPEGGSPDMGTVSADGKYLWLAAHGEDDVYRFDTASGAVAVLKLGHRPHGLLVWPQPGRFSLGYTGLLR